MKISAVQLAKKLVRIESITPNSTRCLNLLECTLKSIGFKCERMVFSSSQSNEKNKKTDKSSVDNLYATLGSGDNHLMFAGHVDVVPTGDNDAWSHPPFSASEVDGMIFGRGICDMKGAIAAFVGAVSQIKKQIETHKNAKISLLITGDEEGEAVNGTVKMLKKLSSRAEKWNLCITGEPTNVDTMADCIKIGRRGSLSGFLKIEGIQGHVGYPHLAKNGLHSLIDVFAKLKAVEFDKGNEFFAPTSLEIVDIRLPTYAINVIPAIATGVFNIRFSSEYTKDSLRRKIVEFFKENLSEIDYTLNIKVSAESFITTPSLDGNVALFAKSVERITAKRPNYSTAGGTSDSRFIKDYCEVFDFGLSGKTIHSIDENVKVKDIETLSHIYEDFIKSYFKFNN